MFGEEVDGIIIDKLLGDPRVGSVLLRDSPTQIAERHAADPRIGRYSPHGNRSVPSPSEVVYFVGSGRRVTPSTVIHAARAGVQQLWVPVGFIWVRIPIEHLVRTCGRDALKTYAYGRDVIARVVSMTRRLNILPRSFADRFLTLRDACDMLVLNARPRSGHVPGRVVLVCGSLAPGGAERQVANTLIGLVDAGIADVLLLAHQLEGGSEYYKFHLPRVVAAGASVREIEQATVGIHDPTIPDVLRQTAHGLPSRLVIDIANLVREFERLRPEVVHAWLDWDNVRAGFAAAIAGVPKILLSGRNLNPSHFLLYQPYMDPAYRALVTLPNVTILNNSRAGADDYADWIGIARDRVKVIHNGVAFGDQGRSSPQMILAARRQYGISDGDFVVGGMFRFAQEKRPLLWLDAAAYIHRAVPEARFLVYGMGPLRAAMEAKIRGLGLGDRVILAGITDDPLAAISLMDVFLLTSLDEGLPNVLLEAQWVGTPVVCTRAGGAPEAVDCGVTGWVVDVDSPQALADAVIHIRRDSNVAAHAAMRGPSFVRERFGISRMIAETLSAYGISAPVRFEDAGFSKCAARNQG
jgi:glycosyltransferase involved in cell wall biosynthesis